LNWRGTALWGFISTLILTAIMSGTQALGLTRMSLPYMLGTMVTSDRDRAKTIGFGMHAVAGWIFASGYAAVFQSRQRANWWSGAFTGLVHALFVLITLMPLLPSLHPRMASEEQGPTPTRQLEPPGFLALHYGRRTPLSVILAHLVFGGILGAYYRVAPAKPIGQTPPQH
jgi:uncharacterized membrane protein YagU involved in acid resistance